MTLRSLGCLILLAAIAATPSSAQSLAASTPEAAWSLVKDLPLSTRLTLTTAEQEFDATLAAVRADELVVTDANLERTTLRQATGAPSGFIVPRTSLTGTRVKKLGKVYQAPPGEGSNTVTVRHVLGALGRPRSGVEIRTADPKPIVGKIDSIGDASVTIVYKKKPIEIPLREIRAARARPLFSRRDVISSAAIIGGIVVVASILGQYAD